MHVRFVAACRSAAVLVPNDVAADYEAFLDGRDPQTITDFSGPFARRDVVEVVVTQQALARGGWTSDTGVQVQSLIGFCGVVVWPRADFSHQCWAPDVQTQDILAVEPHLIRLANLLSAFLLVPAMSLHWPAIQSKNTSAFCCVQSILAT